MLLLLTAALVGLVGLFLLESVIRRTPVGAAILLGAMVLLVTVNTDVVLPVGPFNLFVNDLVFLLLAGAAVARLLRAPSVDRNQLLLIGLLLTVVYSTARGIATIAVDTALNEARQPLRFYAATIYFSTVVPTRALVAGLARLWIVAAAALGVLAVLRWGALAGGVAQGWLASPGDPIRVLNSDEALFLLQAVILGAGALALGRDDLRARAAVAAGGVLVLGLQHRTVWVAAIGCLAVASVRNGRLGRRVAVAVSIGALVLATLLLTAFADDLSAAGGEITARATNQDTFEWRIEGWNQLLFGSGPSGAHEVLAGRPFGSGWERRVFGITIDVAPHNWYLETYLRTGLMGLGLFLALGLRLARACLRGGGSNWEREVVLALLLTQAVYFLTYTPGAVQGIVTGTAIAILRHRGLVGSLRDLSLLRTGRD